MLEKEVINLKPCMGNAGVSAERGLNLFPDFFMDGITKTRRV